VVEKHESERSLIATDSETTEALALMRDTAKANRKQALVDGNNERNFNLTQSRVVVPSEDGSADKELVEYWRYSGELVIWRTISTDDGSAYLDWIQDEINVKMISFDHRDFQRFWYADVDVQNMRRFWLRGAFEFLQQQSAVSNGTPADSALATYLLEADAFMSADKVFISQIKACQKHAPFQVALPVLMPAGPEGVEELFAFIRS
jgi:hypothetical protein